MKRPARLQHAGWLIVLLPWLVFAGVRDDYAQQWPLTLGHGDAGAYRVALDADVYRQIHDAALGDVDVVNADGMAVPAAVFSAEQPLAQPAATREVPWFALPFDSTPQSRDIASISEITADGSLRRVVMRDGDTDESAADGASNEYLVDTSQLHEPVQALRIAWADGQAPFDRPYRIAASDDLKDWRTVQDETHLVELQNGEKRIVGDRIALDGVQARYLRLVPLQKAQRALRLTGVTAELQPRASEATWQWQQPAARRIEAQGRVYFEFDLQGRFPMQRADVVLPGNNTSEWTLESRDDAKAPWQPAAATWMAFQVEGDGTASRSPPQALDRVNRDHYWRLSAKNNMGGAVPGLRLGYRPEVMVFLAQGKAPFAVLAGSARAHRADAPLPQLLEALRTQRGEHWQPADATLGTMQSLAGEQALTPAPVQRDWKSWLLWALLIGGALLVAGFAVSLLRKPADGRSDVM